MAIAGGQGEGGDCQRDEVWGQHCRSPFVSPGGVGRLELIDISAQRRQKQVPDRCFLLSSVVVLYGEAVLILRPVGITWGSRG